MGKNSRDTGGHPWHFTIDASARTCAASGCRHIPLHMLDRFCKLLDVSYEEVLHGATEARIRSDTKPEQTRSYEERFGAIIADCPQDVVEGILSICEQIAHLPGLRK